MKEGEGKAGGEGGGDSVDKNGGKREAISLFLPLAS